MSAMAPPISDICRQHLDFMQWADERLMNAVAEHAPERIAALQHIYLAELVWFRRVCGDGACQIADLEAPGDAASLREAWEAHHREWKNWSNRVADWSVPTPNTTAKGVEYHTPLWQLIFHLVNHGSYHRGQVAAMLRASGIAPPPTDLVAYYRALQA